MPKTANFINGKKSPAFRRFITLDFYNYMFSAIDQLTTVVSGAPMPFLHKNEPVSANLYFHLVLRFEGCLAGEQQETRLKQYIACFVRKTGGSIQSVSVSRDRVNILIGLSQFRALGTFVRELKLVSATFAQRKLGAATFAWRERHDAFTVSHSQIERVCGYIRRQKRLDREESFASSWNRLASQELY